MSCWVGGEHEHGVAAGVAVGDQIDGAHAVVAEHVVLVLEVGADLQEDGGGVRDGGSRGRKVGVRPMICGERTSSLGVLAWRRRRSSAVMLPLRRAGGEGFGDWMRGRMSWARREGLRPRVSGMSGE